MTRALRVWRRIAGSLADVRAAEGVVIGVGRPQVSAPVSEAYRHHLV
jgi:hypothetical protein